MGTKEVGELILIITIIFLIAPAFIIVYIFIYNRRKKNHIEEKAQMKLTFDAEIVKTQLEVQEQTMQTIGIDLHDNIGQLLSLTSLTLNSIELDDLSQSRQKIDSALDLMERSIKELRLLGKLLQGDQLVVFGLTAAIRAEIGWMERSGRYEISYLEEGEPPAASAADKDLITFRILQEILNNIIKHSNAKRINIRLEYITGSLQLQIIDDGIGFDAVELAATQKGMGLHNISKRARIIGGEVKTESKTGKGTCVHVFIPYP